ncbi:MAG: DEAD/DEAH box helicase, partial [Actinomycetota bacterium]
PVPLELITDLPVDEELDELLLRELQVSPLFGVLFRECAARALLLPRRGPDRRTPLWLQRIRAQDLMQLVRRYGEFPILLEAYREAWDDLLRVRDFRKVADGLRSGDIAVRRIATEVPTPFAMHFLFDYNMAFQYVGDYPRAEWRSQLLAVDRDLLARVVRPDALRELLDDRAIERVERLLQRIDDRSRPRGPDELADALDALGDLSERELSIRCGPRWREWVEGLEADRRAVRIEVGGESRWVALEHVQDYGAMGEGDLEAAGRVLRRNLAGRGLVTEEEVAARFGLRPADAAAILLDLRATGEVAAGEFRPAGSGREWVDADNLRRIHRETLQILRQEVEPVDPERYADFLADRHLAPVPATEAAGRGVLERLAGIPVPAAALVPEVLVPRFRDGDTSPLERVIGSGAFLWQGLPGRRVAVIPRDAAARMLRSPGPAGAGAVLIEDVLRSRGASFLSEVASAGQLSEKDALAALFELVWAGRVTNDALAGIQEPPR